MSVLETVAAELEAEIETNRGSIERIYTLVRDEERDLTDTEEASIDRLGETNEALKVKLARATRDYGLDDEARGKIRAVATPATVYRSAGELLWDMLHAGDDPDARRRYASFQRGVDQSRRPVRIMRAAEHLGLDSANTVPVAGGFNGLVTIPNIGPVLDPSPQGAPLFAQLSPIPATSATFQRPRIVDENFDDAISEDIQEKAEGPSKAWDILAEPLTLKMQRGYINVSELLLEMVAGSLDMVVGHMNARLEWRIERSAIAAIGATTNVIPLAADADAAAFQAAIGQAVVAVFQTTQRWPTWIAFGPIAAGRIIGMTDLAGRPLFPFLGPANASGTASNVGVSTISGLNPVPTPGITDASMYVGNSQSIEAYLRRFPIMQALEPALFGRQIGVAAATQFYSPITTEEVTGGTPAPAKREGVAKIAWA